MNAAFRRLNILDLSNKVDFFHQINNGEVEKRWQLERSNIMCVCRKEATKYKLIKCDEFDPINFKNR